MVRGLGDIMGKMVPRVYAEQWLARENAAQEVQQTKRQDSRTWGIAIASLAITALGVSFATLGWLYPHK